MPIDEVLTRGRVAVQERVKARRRSSLTAATADAHRVCEHHDDHSRQIGLSRAFQDVADSMADREKVINEARATRAT